MTFPAFTTSQVYINNVAYTLQITQLGVCGFSLKISIMNVCLD